MKKYKYTKAFTYEGKRYYVRGDSLEEVYSKKALKLQELKGDIVPVTSSMTVEAWANKAIAIYKADIKDISREDVEYRINKFILPHIGKIPLCDVRPVHCMEVLNAQAGKSDSQVSKVYTNLAFIFRTAYQNSLIKDDPMKAITKPKAPKGRRRSITEDERTHLLAVADKFPQFNVYLLMLYCGCRPSEARGCIYKDITIIDNVRMLHIRGTKTENSDRYVPLPDAMYDRLPSGGDDEPIAKTETGRAYDKQSFVRTFKRLKREINISMGCKLYRNQLIEPLPLADDLVPYCFRHTYCTDLCRAGIDVRIAQRLMGHSNISTTVDIYTHVENSDLAGVASLLNSYNANQ